MDMIMTEISIRMTVLENLIKDDEERLAFYTKKRNALATEEGEIVALHLDCTVGEIRGLLKGRKAELQTLKALMINLNDNVSARNGGVQGRGEEGDED